MRGDAPRRRALEGPVPLGPMPYEPALEVAVLPVSRRARRKSLDATMKNDWSEHPGTNGLRRESYL